MEVFALLRRADRRAWRGHGPDWLRTAERLAFAAEDPVALRRLASVVEDVRLLRPAVACAVRLPPRPARRRGRPPPPDRGGDTTDEEGADDRRAGLWRDVQHLLLSAETEKAPPADAAYVGALVYFVRMRRRLPSPSTVAAIRAHCRPGLLRLVVRSEVWDPPRVAPHQDRTRARTVLLALAVDTAAEPDAVAAARGWLREHPSLWSYNDQHPDAAAAAVDATSNTEGFDPFTSDALRLFADP